MNTGCHSQFGTHCTGQRQSEVDAGVCYVCARWSGQRRRIVIHDDHDMLICWVCPDCDIIPDNRYRTNEPDNGTQNKLERGGQEQ